MAIIDEARYRGKKEILFNLFCLWLAWTIGDFAIFNFIRCGKFNTGSLILHDEM